MSKFDAMYKKFKLNPENRKEFQRMEELKRLSDKKPTQVSIETIVIDNGNAQVKAQEIINAQLV